MTACIVAAATFSPGVVTLSGEDTAALAVDPVSATAQLRVTNGGIVEEDVGAGFNQVDSATDWIIPNHLAPGAYEVRLTVNSGTTPSGASTGTWIALSTTRTWSLTQSGVGTTSGNYTIEIRLGDGAAIASGTYTMSAQVISP